MKGLIYLACPYSKPLEEPKPGHGDARAYMRVRAHDAGLAALRLMQAGYSVFSPISHGHAIVREAWALKMEIGVTIHVWLPVDTAMIQACDMVYILTLPGWEDSDGIRQEIRYARSWCKPVYLLAPGHEMQVSEYREAA